MLALFAFLAVFFVLAVATQVLINRRTPIVMLAFLLVAASADAGPIRNLIHKITHPLAGRHQQLASSSCQTRQQQPATTAAAPSTAQPLSCPGGNCPVPQRK